ncbi:MAG: hypothetical protein Q9196_007198 [Gyalolechia fulgens]
MPPNRKRKLYIEAKPSTDSSLPHTAKRPKLDNKQRHRTPSWFWDNLSRVWLSPGALQEFDRRTVWPVVPVPPGRISKREIDPLQLKRFARHGGPALSDLRAYPGPHIATASYRTMDPSQSGSRKRAKTGGGSDISSRNRRSSAYSPGFEQHLIDHGIYPDGYDDGGDDDDGGSVYPANWEEINERLARPRQSLSPSRFPREAFQNFRKKNLQALTENTVMSRAFPIIAGTSNIPSQENLIFGNLKDLTDGSITKAMPDFYDGSRPAELKKEIREELGPYIVPSTNTAAPCLPNFFTEGKGPNGSSAVCKRQALHDSALGARGVHKLRSYTDPETLCDGKAYTITSTYHGGTGDLTIYSTHPTPSNGSQNKMEYRMIQLDGWKMTGNPDAFRQGASALRNAREWAKEKREELIAAANGKVPDAERSDLVSSTQSFGSPSSNMPTHPESETSADELALDVDTKTN